VTTLAWRSPADLRGASEPSVGSGELILAGETLHPHYQLIALGEDKAWVRDLQLGTDHIIPIDRCRKTGSRGSSPW
jgi:hypothetical protein